MDKTGLYAKAFLVYVRGMSGPELSGALLRLIDLLKKREETALYPRILKKIISALEYEEMATVISARPLDKKLETEVSLKIKKNFPDISKENIKFLVDEKMMGGISLSYRDFLFDGTVRETLRKLKMNQ